MEEKTSNKVICSSPGTVYQAEHATAARQGLKKERMKYCL